MRKKEVTRKQVWKYEIPMLAPDFRLEIPKNASIVHVECQQGIPMMWAEIDPDKEMETFRFRIAGTGHDIIDIDIYDIDDEATYEGYRTVAALYHEHLGTWLQAGFVWHLFRMHLAEPDIIYGVEGQD